MKKILIAFVASLCIGIYSRAQNFSLGFSRNNIAYIGIDNPFTCIVQGVSSASVVLTAENGTIEKSGGINYKYRPVSVADAKIIINRKEKGKLVKVGIYYVRTRHIPEPEPTIGGVPSEDTMTAGQLRAQVGVGAYAVDFGFDLRYEVIGFCLSIIRNNQVVFFNKTKGYRFNEETLMVFKTLEKNDIILVSSITLTGPDKVERKTRPIEYTIY